MSFDFTYTPSRGPDRSQARRQGEEAVTITERGSYVAPSGREVSVAAGVERAVQGTVDVRPEESVALPSPGARPTRTSVVNGTSLASARALALRGAHPYVLNFASAKNPGGGFLGGARAQEESLARSSALYACIRRSPMYAHHRAHGDCLYTDWMIHSPSVPVFRDDDTGALLEEPYLCSFLTAPAPNAGVVLEREPDRAAEVERTMRARVRRSLAIAAREGHRHLVLGAWGCGVFKNDPAVVAGAYRSELDGAFAGVFDEVVFAVLDWSDDRRFVRPFAERF
ncbi:MAG: TIGR02452 family protein [Labilithrix sp.]|nr:TIGR02452 family protein [Labilithrix sp.]MCW5813234.1 TIGR02452 family protein [Labilithrix sp.]